MYTRDWRHKHHSMISFLIIFSHESGTCHRRIDMNQHLKVLWLSLYAASHQLRTFHVASHCWILYRITNTYDDTRALTESVDTTECFARDSGI